MKKLLFILFIAISYISNGQLTSLVVRNDTIFNVDPSTGVWTQLTKNIPPQTGQSGKMLSTNGSAYQWVTGLLNNGDGSALTGLTKSQVGLGNVDNTSDANKPVSTAQQTALNAKQNTITTGTTAQYFMGDLSLSTFPTTTAPFSNSTNKNFVTDAQATVIGNTSGTNTGDNAVNSLYSGLVSNATHTGDATGSTALTVVRINGTQLSSLGTGLLKNTTGTGVPSIAVSGTDVKTINGTSLLGSGDVGISGASTTTYVNLASPFSSTSTTEAAVTGWSFAVTAGKAYRVEVIGLYQTAATTTGGELGFFLTNSDAGTIAGNAEGAIVSSAAASSLSQQISAIGAADLAGSNLITTGVTAINSPHYIKATVVFICTVSGTFNVGWASEVNASASQLNAGSALIYQVLN